MKKLIYDFLMVILFLFLFFLVGFFCFCFLKMPWMLQLFYFQELHKRSHTTTSHYGFTVGAEKRR